MVYSQRFSVAPDMRRVNRALTHPGDASPATADRDWRGRRRPAIDASRIRIAPKRARATRTVFNLVLLLKAMLAGFAVAVPIGAIGAMCVRRALQGRWLAGLVTGLGAAIADTVLATAAMFGLSLLTHYILDNRRPVLLIGGLFLIFIGLRMITKRHPRLDAEAPPTVNDQLRRWRAWPAALATGFVLTIVNPATLIAFVGAFAGLGLFQDQPQNLLRSWIVIVGAFTGSTLWWATLTGTAVAVRRHLSLNFVVVLNVMLGLLVLGFGFVGLLSVFGVEV
jgi:threonine/homoserine/homoserine lactone efflux protein